MKSLHMAGCSIVLVGKSEGNSVWKRLLGSLYRKTRTNIWLMDYGYYLKDHINHRMIFWIVVSGTI